MPTALIRPASIAEVQAAVRAAPPGSRILARGRGTKPPLSTPPEGAIALDVSGLTGIIDPPREEAITAVAACQRAGIRVKMITGDHAVTARTIGRALGIGDGETSLSGHELAAISDTDLPAAARRGRRHLRLAPK